MQRLDAEQRLRRYSTVERVMITAGTVVMVGIVVLLIVLVVGRYQDSATVQDTRDISRNQVAVSARNDCRSTIATARRSVFDDVDIYKAIQADQLATALLNSTEGIRSTPEERQAFADNADLLHGTLREARRLQPPQVLDDIIAHGGMIAGVRYDPCPKVGSRR